MSFKLESIQSQNYRNASKVMHFGKVYFDPFLVSLGTCGCIYDNKSIKLCYLNLNLNSLLVKRQIDNPSPGAVTGGN